MSVSGEPLVRVVLSFWDVMWTLQLIITALPALSPQEEDVDAESHSLWP